MRYGIIRDGKGYPACAGIDPRSSGGTLETTGLPRMRGDRPVACAEAATAEEATPHARGSTPV